MSEAIRCGQCRWFKDRDPFGTCELNPPVHIGYPMDCETMEWQQPIVFEGNGCSRGEPKASSLTVSDGDPVAMVDGLPVFRPKTEDQP